MKVLIVRTGAMGDVIHTLPAVAALAAQKPEWQIDWVVDPRWEPLLCGNNSFITQAHIVPTKEWSAAPFSLKTLRSILALRKQIRAEHYDLVIDIQGSIRSGFIGSFACARQYFGFDDPRESFAKRLYKQTAPRTGTHVVEMNAALLSAATGLSLTPQPFALPLIQSAEIWAEQEAVFARPLAVLAPGGGWGAKQWPAVRFAELGKRLAAMGYDVAVNSPTQDDRIPNEVVKASGYTARLVVSDVAGLVALLRRTDLFVGNDSGPTHLAAALAVPTVALFGPTDPHRNGPWGPGAKRVLRDPAAVTSYKHTDEPDPTLASLKIEEVMDAVWGLAISPGS